MPLPRKPRLKRRTVGTRASRRFIRDTARLKAMLMARFIALHEKIERRKQYTYRGAYGAISYFKPGEPIPPGYQKVEYDENGHETPPYVKEKVPGLATEDSSDAVIPGEDPGPPETRALAAVPDRRAARLSGTTVLTD